MKELETLSIGTGPLPAEGKYRRNKAFQKQTHMAAFLSCAVLLKVNSRRRDRKIGTAVRRLRNNLGTNKVIAVCVLAWGCMPTSGLGLLHAQQTADLPFKPTHDTSTKNISLPNVPSNNASVPSPHTLTFAERLKIYERSFTNPESLIGPALGAGIGQADNTPPEWGQGGAGYGRRFASGYGRSVIGRTIGFGVAAVDHEDPRFVPSNKSGLWRRTRHAVVGTFVSRTNSGGTMPAYSRFAGVYGAAFIGNAWEPPSQDHIHKALERGSTALLSSVGWRVLAEFWPDIRKAFHHKK
ncbi:MAG: hypothetical protein LAN18_04075 [Acidobacteriia bacterium]|nr:hypothetical protein [Terriglobia bacterium]